MTKKDFELIASSLSYCKPSKIAKPQGFDDRFITWKGIVYDMTLNLASKNPRFQSEKFLKACGVEENEDVCKKCYLEKGPFANCFCR